MNKSVKPFLNRLVTFCAYIAFELKGFTAFFKIYLKDKLLIVSGSFEGYKNEIVKSILIKRGKRNRMFLHVSAMMILTIGVLISPFISDSSLFGKEKNNTIFAQNATGEASLSPDDVFQTQASEKPRDKVISYTVQKGDTISTIAKKFGISTDTIKWANDLKNDSITVGDTLDILPVAGIVHKVERGDSVYSVAKKYASNAQAIVDYPFNDFANPQTFSLVEGQMLIVPDGVRPEEAPKYIRQTYIASGPTVVTGAGFTWPVHGTLNQFYSWYHKGIDIGGATGTPIVAAQSGRVSEAHASGWNWGYGDNVVIAGDNGYSTLYAHLSGINVAPGDVVVAGKSVIGWLGSTGRSTGPHLHLEIRGGASGFSNPLSFLH